MRHCGATHAGNVRENNEDAWTAAELPNGFSLFVVSDGVGGHAGGETASRIVVETLPLLLEEYAGRAASIPALQRVLKRSLIQLSRVVEQQARDIPGLGGLAATVVCCLTDGWQALVGHMGDSRCYLLRQGRLELQTRDHTVARMLLDIGEITHKEFRRHPGQARLTQAVGMGQEPMPEVQALDLEPGDWLLLCSDGLHGQVEDEDIAGLLTPPAPPEELCDRLVQAALEAGGGDNITALLVEL